MRNGLRKVRAPAVAAKAVACMASAAASVAVLASAADAIGKDHRSGIPGDPYTDPAGEHRTAVEPSAVAAGSTVVTAFQVGRHFVGGADNIAWARSTTKGASWTGAFLPGITAVAGGPWSFVSDPSVAYDRKHRAWLVAAVDGNTTPSGPWAFAISVNRSLDNGQHWSVPTYADFSADFHDKDWIACDDTRSSPFFGTCYLTWEDLAQQVFMQRSTDGGRTWSAPFHPAGAIGQGGEPVVQPNGKVIVPYLGLPPSINAFSSSDGGATWSGSVKVADVEEHSFGTNLRNYATPSVGVAGDGRVFVAWQDCRFESPCVDDVVMSSSADGTNWSPVSRVTTGPTGSGRDSVSPALAVDPSSRGDHTRIAISYYKDDHAGCAAPCTLSVETVASRDGGTRWTPPQVLARGIDTRWLAQTSVGPMTGDYTGEVFVHHDALAVYAVAKPPIGSVLRERVVSTRGNPDVG